MDFESLVIKKLDQIEGRQTKHDEKQDAIQADVHAVKIEQAKQMVYIEQNTRDLTEHKEGVVGNRKRIQFLEQANAPLTVKQLLQRIALIAGGIGTVAGAAIAVIKLLGH